MEHEIVSRDEWVAARKQHLLREKELTRLRDELSAERQSLPWVKVEKDYVFDTAQGKRRFPGALLQCTGGDQGGVILTAEHGQASPGKSRG